MAPEYKLVIGEQSTSPQSPRIGRFLDMTIGQSQLQLTSKLVEELGINGLEAAFVRTTNDYSTPAIGMLKSGELLGYVLAEGDSFVDLRNGKPDGFIYNQGPQIIIGV